jgi:hypothetical protein
MNLKDPDFWLQLKPQSAITLKDEKSLLKDMSGVETLVKRIIKLPECEGLCTWLLLELEEATDKATQWLMVKIVGDEIDFRIYHLPAKFERGNRDDLVFGGENEGHWVFQEPEVEDDGEEMTPQEIFGDDEDEQTFEGSDEEQGIILNDLVYADEFDWDGETYRKKAQGDFACGDFGVFTIKDGDSVGIGSPPIVETPKPSGIDYNQLATLAEYVADSDKAKEPEAVVFEIGDADDDNGGLVSLMIGHSLAVTDLDILAK